MKNSPFIRLDQSAVLKQSLPAIWGESQEPVAYERALVLTRQEPDVLSGR